MIDDHKSLHEKVRNLDDRSRGNFLQFDGLSQAYGADWHVSEAKIKNPIKEKLGIENVEIELDHKIGKEKGDEPSLKRTIVAKFLNCKDKAKVLRE